jgi:hypothetical protein
VCYVWWVLIAYLHKVSLSTAGLVITHSTYGLVVSAYNLIVRRTSSVLWQSGFRRDGDEICAVLGYYAAPTGSCLPTLRDKLSVPFNFLTLEDGADKFSRNVGKILPLDATWYLRRSQISLWQSLATGIRVL